VAYKVFPTPKPSDPGKNEFVSNRNPLLFR
jgi:hypothetical protein